MDPAPSLRATRRGFLSLAAASAALTALSRLPAAAAVAASRCETTFFSEHETELLTGVVERMVATGAPDAPAVRETGSIQVIDRICAGLDPGVSGVLPNLLRLVEWGPLLFDFTPTRFSKMSDAEKDASLRAWMTSRLDLRRRAFYALRNLSYLGYYSQDATWGLIGYQGPFVLPEETPP
jgi:hypothetical protein